MGVMDDVTVVQLLEVHTNTADTTDVVRRICARRSMSHGRRTPSTWGLRVLEALSGDR